MEKRAYAAEVRAQGRKLEGYAATFDNPANIGGQFIETISAGAFAATLRTQPDILALVDHDAGKVLGRTRSGTLRLSEDSKGLAFSLDLPQTQAGRDVLALAERGDLGGMSFGFTVRDEAITGTRRDLRAVDLHEVSVVLAWPAYDGTVIHARGRGLVHPARAAVARRVQIWRAGQ